MSVCVIIPFGGDDPDRVVAFAHVVNYYRHNFPTWGIMPGWDHSPIFSRARAINNAANTQMAQQSDILVINDADTLCYSANVVHAVTLATEAPGLVRAYTRYRRVNRAYSMAADSWRAFLPAPDDAIEWEQDPAYAHGCVAVRRSCFETVGGYDPNFEGWGYEDMAAEMLYDAFWPDRRVTGDLFHIWHEPISDAPEVVANADRYYRLYEPRRGDREGLMAAREEA